MSDAYLDFLRSKIPQAEVCGFEPLSDPHPSLFPHQVDIARWMCRGGRRACFADFARELERENSRLRCAIQTAIDYANGRESEWGERAEGAFAVLYSALANTKTTDAEATP